MVVTLEDGFETLRKAGEPLWATAQEPVYSLGGGGFDSFNVGMETPISDNFGHWWDSGSQSWQNDSGGAYDASQSPTSYDWSFDDSPVPFAPDSWDEPAPDSWGEPVPFAPESWGEPQPEQTDYSLNFPTSAFTGYGNPNAQSPWGAAQQEPDDDGGFWGGVRDVAGDIGGSIGGSIMDTAGTFGNVIAAPYVAAEDLFSDKTDTGFNERVGANFSGEQFQDTLGIDTDYMDWLREQGLIGKTAAYGIDTLTAPATILTAGMGSEVPLIGSAFGGGFAKRLAGEAAVGTTAYLGSDAAVSDVADKIPYFSDQPDWLRGLEGGAIGGTVAFGGLKAVGKAGAALGPEDFAPEGAPQSIYKPSPFRVGDESQYPLDVARAMPPGKPIPRLAGASDDVPLFGKGADTALSKPIDTASLFENRAGITGRGIPEGTGRLASSPVPPQTNLFGDIAKQPVFRGDETTAVMQARKAALDTLQGNREIRRSGVTATEVSQGRRAQAGGILSGYEKGIADGLTGGDLLDSAVDNIPSGRIIKTNAGEITGADRNALKDVVAQWMSEDPNSRVFEARTARDVLDAMAMPGGYNPQPHEDALLRKILGDELTDTVSSRLKGAGVEGAKVELPTRPLDLGAQTKAVQPPIESLRPGKFVTEEQRAQNFVDTLDARKKAADDYIKGFAGREQNPNALDMQLGQSGQQLGLADAKLPDGIYKSGTPSPKPRTMTPVKIMQMGRQAFGEAFALPRAVKSSLDLSAPLRQGAMLSWRHPKAAADAFADQMRAWKSPAAAKKIDDMLNARPNARIHAEAGLYRAQYDEAAKISAREEAFLSRLAPKIPGVRASNRAYATYLNKIRADSFDSVWNSLPELEKTSDTATALARFINVASGRGELPGILDGAGPLLGQILYSPRFVISRPQALWMAASGNGNAIARKEALKTLAAYFGGTSTVLALGAAGGLWDVELDPRSADFGKGRIGALRYDFWTGYSQLARLGAQVTTGQRKSTTTGDIYELDSRMEPFARFARSKLNPTTGQGVNILTGSDYKGDKLEGPLSQLLELVVPIQPAEMVRAYEDYGWEMALATLPGFIGAGTGVYSPSDYEKRDKQSMEKFGVPYSEQTTEQRLEFTDAYGKIPSANPQVKLALEKATTAQQGADQKLADTGLNYNNAKEWRDTFGDNKDNLRFLKDVVYADAGTKPGGDPILDAYYARMNASVKYGKPDWDAMDSYVKSLFPEDQKYIKDHTGFIQIDTPTTRAFETAKDSIENSGYFERSDQTWKQVADVLGLKEPDYYAWRDAKAEEYRQMFGSTKNDLLAASEIDKLINKDPVAKAFDNLSKEWKTAFVLEHPAEAYLAWQWGYYLPTDQFKAYLQAEVGNAIGR